MKNIPENLGLLDENSPPPQLWLCFSVRSSVDQMGRRIWPNHFLTRSRGIKRDSGAIVVIPRTATMFLGILDATGQALRCRDDSSSCGQKPKTDGLIPQSVLTGSDSGDCVFQLFKQTWTSALIMRLGSCKTSFDFQEIIVVRFGHRSL